MINGNLWQPSKFKWTKYSERAKFEASMDEFTLCFIENFHALKPPNAYTTYLVVLFPNSLFRSLCV